MPIYGGGQERGLRSGTENVALIVALGEAARLAGQETTDLRGLRDELHDRLTGLLPGRVRLNGHPTRRLPNTLNISITGTSGRHILAATPEIAASTGSACHEGVDHPSPVLTAMGLPLERAASALRLTVGRRTTQSDLSRAAAAIAATALGTEPGTDNAVRS